MLSSKASRNYVDPLPGNGCIPENLDKEDNQRMMMNSQVGHNGREQKRIFIIPPSSFTLDRLHPLPPIPRVCGRRAHAAWPVRPSARPSGGRPLIRKYFRREIIALFDQGRNNGEGGTREEKSSLWKNQNLLPPSARQSGRAKSLSCPSFSPSDTVQRAEKA